MLVNVELWFKPRQKGFFQRAILQLPVQTLFLIKGGSILLTYSMGGTKSIL